MENTDDAGPGRPMWHGKPRQQRLPRVMSRKCLEPSLLPPAELAV